MVGCVVSITYVDVPMSEQVSVIMRESQYPPSKSGRYYMQIIKRDGNGSVSINLRGFWLI